MHPRAVITIDGTPIAGVLWERLLSVSITDKEGFRSDTIDLDFDAGAPLIAVPRKKAIITCQLGYLETGMADFGRYTADDITLHCYPYKLQVQGKSADMRSGLKEQKSRNWDNSTFGDVVKKIASENGLTPQIAPRLAQFRNKTGYFAQENESGLHMIERITQRLDGLFVIKAGRLIVAEKGSGQTAGGGALTPLVITPPMHIEGSCEIKWAGRDQHKKVRANYDDDKKAKRESEEADSDEEGEGTLTLRHRYASKAEAKSAATAKAKDLKRSSMTFKLTLEGNVAARGGAPVSLQGFHPNVDGQPFIIETASHKFDKRGGYTTEVSAKQKA